MKINIAVSYLLVVLLIVGCKDNASTSAEVGKNEIDASEASEQYQQMVEEGGVLIKEDIVVAKDNPLDKDDGNHDWTFLIKDMLHFRNVVDSRGDINANPKQDHWIDLKEDGTYSEGILDQTSHSGRWMYNHPNQLLTLVPEPNNVKNSQWKVMYNDDMLVLVGTQRYADNAIQMRLVRSDKFPGQ